MLRYATVTTVDTSTCKVTFKGETVESSMNFYRLENYIPTLNDVVAVDTSAKLILGKVVR